MDRFLRGYWRVLSALARAERAIGVALVGAIVLTISLQVCTRYFFGQPMVWVEETATYAFIWAVFIGAALGMKELRHIRIESIVTRLAPRSQALMRALIWAMATFAAVFVGWQAWDIMEIEGRSKTIGLPVELPRHLFYSVPLFVCLASIALTGVYLVVAELARAACGRQIEAEIAAQLRAHDADS